MPTSEVKLCEMKTSKGSVMVPYEVHRRKGLRYLRVMVDDSDRVKLKVPYRVSEERALVFLREQGDWIVEVLNRTPQKVALHEFLLKQKTLSVSGCDIPCSIRFCEERLGFRFVANEVELSVERKLEMEGPLKRVLQALAREVIPPRVAELAARHGLSVRRVTIRDQRTRWGACTDRKTLSLNWRLVLLPAELQDHIILHELAHLTHLDHSNAFWELLRAYDPACTRNDRLLTQVSRALMRMGRE